MGKLTGKIALITGGTSGIGAATAKVFAYNDANVIIVGRDEEKGILLAKTINSDLDKSIIRFIKCDVTKIDDTDRLYDIIYKEYGRLDILFNNAGVLITKSLEEITDNDWSEVFDVNVKAVMNMTKKFMGMLCNARGSIINNASVAGLHSHTEGKRAYLYASSKAAVIQFTKLCALNYAKEVRINCVCPGIIDTPIYTNKDYSRFAGIPMGRVGTAEEMAKVILFLASNDASYLTGVVLPVDGGSSLV